MTQKQIRTDLRDIRYYYARKTNLDKVFILVENEVKQKAESYNRLMQSAPPRLFELYFELYVHCHTQVEIAKMWGFCVGYIRNLHQKLCVFLQNAFAEKMKGGEKHV